MVIEYVRYKIPADQADQFIAACATAGEALRKSSHCLGFELSRCTEPTHPKSNADELGRITRSH